AVALGQALQGVDVVQGDAGQLAAGGLHVARDGDVDEDQRAPVALAGDDRQLVVADDRVRGGGGGDDDVGLGQPLGQVVQRRDLAAEALGQRARAVGAP